MDHTHKVRSSSLSTLRQLTIWNPQTLDGFFSSCLDAGPSRCALYQPNSTLATLHSRLASLRSSLLVHPLPVSSLVGSGILTTSAVQHAIFRGLYSPVGWPALAEALADAERGDGTKLYSRLNGGWDLAPRDPTNNVFNRTMDVAGSGLTCSVQYPRRRDAVSFPFGARAEPFVSPQQAIMCADTDLAALEDVSHETLIAYMREMGALSISGEAWSWWIAQCRRWSFRAKDVYRGPWTVADGLKKTKSVFSFL
jgi:hypothetical protein